RGPGAPITPGGNRAESEYYVRRDDPPGGAPAGIRDADDSDGGIGVDAGGLLGGTVEVLGHPAHHPQPPRRTGAPRVRWLADARRPTGGAGSDLRRPPRPRSPARRSGTNRCRRCGAGAVANATAAALGGGRGRRWAPARPTFRWPHGDPGAPAA